jgi:hypothetical protein
MGTIFDIKRNLMWRSGALDPLPRIIGFIIVCWFPFIGCTMMAKPPTETIAIAELSLRAAAEARADEFAPMDLQKARESVDASKKALALGKYDEARRFAESAQVEAELAEAKSDAEITRLAADRLRQRTVALRQEIEGRLTRGSTATPKE